MNEVKNLPHVATRMPDGIMQIVVVDGNSTDGTPELARELWPDATIVNQTRRGKGNALACGFARATGDFVVMIDSDGSTDPAEIPYFVEALEKGADFAKGTRFCSGGGSSDITRLRRLGNKGLSGMVNSLFDARFTDLCYGYNAFRRECLEVFALPDIDLTGPQWGDGFEIETLINIRVALAGLSITEIASYERDRIFGESNLNAMSDGIRVLRTIVDERGARRLGPPEHLSSRASGRGIRLKKSRVRLAEVIAGSEWRRETLPGQALLT